MGYEMQKLAGYLFNGRFYKSLDDLRGRTMSEDNKPVAVYFKDEDQSEWKFCPSCGINWDLETGSDKFGCWNCGFVRQ